MNYLTDYFVGNAWSHPQVQQVETSEIDRWWASVMLIPELHCSMDD